MLKVTIRAPEDEEATWLEVVDQDGNELCQVHYDHQPNEVAANVASSICKAAGIEFEDV